MSSRTTMSQSINMAHPSKSHKNGVKKRENAKSVDWSGFLSRQINRSSWDRASGVIDTGLVARELMLCDSTWNATVSRGSKPTKTLIN